MLFVFLFFQLFRETKESEIQNLLRAKQDLENHLSKLSYGGHTPDDDSHSRPGIVDLGCQLILSFIHLLVCSCHLFIIVILIIHLDDAFVSQ